MDICQVNFEILIYEEKRGWPNPLKIYTEAQHYSLYLTCKSADINIYMMTIIIHSMYLLSIYDFKIAANNKTKDNRNQIAYLFS